MFNTFLSTVTSPVRDKKINFFDIFLISSLQKTFLLHFVIFNNNLRVISFFKKILPYKQFSENFLQ